MNLAFFGANAVYWQVRFEPSARGRAGPCDGRLQGPEDRPGADPTVTTVNWREPVVNRPEQTLIGVQYTAETKNDGYFPYVVTNSSNWVYAGTGLRDGDSLPGLVGYEADRSFAASPRPVAVAGTYTLLSHSPFTNASNASDYSERVDLPGPQRRLGIRIRHDGLELGVGRLRRSRRARHTHPASDGQHPEPVHRRVACTESGRRPAYASVAGISRSGCST